MLDIIVQYLDLMGEKVILFKQHNLQLIKITGMQINQAVHKTNVTLKLRNQELVHTRARHNISNVTFFY